MSTPESLYPEISEEGPLPVAPLERRRRPWILALMAAGGLLVLGSVVLYFLILAPPPLFRILPSPSPSPFPAEFTPPPSLAELVQQYPQLAPLLTDPELDSAYKQFLVAYQEGGKEAAIDLARRRGLLNDRDEIRITLILDTEDPAPLVAQLEKAGIRVIAAYRDTVEIAVPLSLIETTAGSGDPGAFFAQLTELQHVIAVRVPALHIRHGSRIPGEGTRVIGADRWHQAGFTGAGIRVGVLDMGFAGYQALLGRELPDTVVVEYFGDWDSEEVHGTACAEIIHEIAPGAELFFAWYDGTDAAEGEAVDWLLAQGVHIISHSAGSVADPRDGTGRQARLVDSVAARGVLWVNSAGNWAQSHYRAPFTDTDGDGVHEFAPGQERMPLDLYVPEIHIFLVWDDVWGRASQDYDLYLTDEEGTVLASSEDFQSGQPGHEPVEEIAVRWLIPQTPYVAIGAHAVDRPAMLEVFVHGAGVAYPSPEYSLSTPADALGALAVGATHWRRDTLEEYSSQGPTTDGRLKPEISAPTDVSTASYDEPYGGTSASAPHVAGAAALVWSAYPEFDRQQVIDFLLTHAVDRGPRGPDTGYGYGRLQLPPPPAAQAAVAPSPPPPAAQTPSLPTPAAPSPAPTVLPPLPTPTPVPFVTPGPSPAVGAGTVTSLIWLAGAMGMLGTGLLLAGATVWFLGRRTSVPPYPSPMPPGVPPYLPKVPPTPRVGPPPPHPPSVPPAPPVIPPSPLPSAPISCSACGASLRPGARFCPRCGQPVSPPHLACPSCGASLRPGARFCPRCGKAVSPPSLQCPSCGAPARPGARFCSRCGHSL